MKKVLILFGGKSFEHEISCKSVNYIIKSIDKDIYNIKVVGITYNNEWLEINDYTDIDNNWAYRENNKIDNIIEYLKSFDVVFPVIHGSSGEDGKLQSLFELFNIKYIGCNSRCSLVCYDKLLTKLLLEKYNIPQVPYIIYKESTNLNILDYPVIIKPCKCGSSIGINIANNVKEAKKAIKEALKYDSDLVIEKYIKEKRELECAVITKNKKLIISDIGEIISNDEFYDYDSKYKLKTETKISDIDTNIKKDIQDYSSKIFNILKCKNLSRLDFIYDLNDKKLYFNEINTIPGFTEISMYPLLLNNIGIDNNDIINTLIDC